MRPATRRCCSGHGRGREHRHRRRAARRAPDVARLLRRRAAPGDQLPLDRRRGGDDGQIRLTGEITIKGITKPIELTGTVAEGGADPWGNERVGFEVEGVIDRREFELKWNQTLPNGNLLVSNEVKLLVSVSAVKAA